MSHWEEASLLHLEALQCWLRNHLHDINTQRAFLLHMVNEKSLRKLTGQPKDFVRKYLSYLPDAKTINPESANLILEMAEDPQVILYALKVLIQSQSEVANQIFWKALEEGRFSVTDAGTMLSKYPKLAIQLVHTSQLSVLRSQLIHELANQNEFSEFLIKIGSFVLFDGGWGEIKEVQGSKNPNSFYFDEAPSIIVEVLHLPSQNIDPSIKRIFEKYSELQARLSLARTELAQAEVERELRIFIYRHPRVKKISHLPRQRVRLNLSEGKMELINSRGAYSCGCGRFIAFGGVGYEPLWERHAQTCSLARKELRTPIPAIKPLIQPLSYCAIRPMNEFDTRDSQEKSLIQKV